VLVLNGAQVEALVDLDALIDALGRQSPGQITLYKSIGVAVEDAVAAALAVAAARRHSAGQHIDL
jgi:ornithine cyclodeaminase/alanine dehydrogenase-like protein (mu-crystallin family)